MATCHSGVYEIVNIVNGHRYIGSSVNVSTRLNGHMSGLRRNEHPNSHLQNAYHKYGEEVFVCYPLLYCDPENVLLFEQMCIDGLRPEYNIAKDAIASARGLKHSEDHNRKISESKTGVKRLPFSEEWKRKIGESGKGNHNTLCHPLSEDHKQKISISEMGRVISEDTKLKMSEAHKGKKQTVEHIQNNVESHRKHREERRSE